MTHRPQQGGTPLNCKQTAERVCEARDRGLSPSEQDEVGAHLRICPLCQLARRQFSAVFRDLDELLGNEERP